MIVYGNNFMVDAKYIRVDVSFIDIFTENRSVRVNCKNYMVAGTLFENMQKQFMENGEIDLRGKY